MKCEKCGYDPTDVVEVVCIIDRSGSMMSIREDAIGGFNRFLEEQKSVPGKAKLTLVLFNDKMKVVYNRVDIQEVAPLNDRTYVPNGWTALYDAIGNTLNETFAVGSRGICVILTDGQENASKEFSRKGIKRLIEKQEDRGWKIHYLGANQDSFEEAGKVGINRINTMNFDPDQFGTKCAYDYMSTSVTNYRTNK